MQKDKKSWFFSSTPGQPNRANITSRGLSFYSDRYNLTWAVFSYSEVLKYRILYRKVIVSTFQQCLIPIVFGGHWIENTFVSNRCLWKIYTDAFTISTI